MFFMRQTKAPGLSVSDAISGCSNGTVTVIDVREHSEVRSGKAKGALHIPLMRLRDMADPSHPDFVADLAPDRPIAVYCASGARSQSAVRILNDLGYAQAHNIGGLAHWAQAGGALDA